MMQMMVPVMQTNIMPVTGLPAERRDDSSRPARRDVSALN
jgi:hypothetical protein